MNFEFTDDQLPVQKLCRDFASRNISPSIQENGRQQKFDPELLGRMAKADLIGLCLPEKYGGAGMDYISLGLFVVRLSRFFYEYSGVPEHNVPPLNRPVYAAHFSQDLSYGL